MITENRGAVVAASISIIYWRFFKSYGIISIKHPQLSLISRWVKGQFLAFFLPHMIAGMTICRPAATWFLKYKILTAINTCVGMYMYVWTNAYAPVHMYTVFTSHIFTHINICVLYMYTDHIKIDSCNIWTCDEGLFAIL
jgi:hypothetical protein